MIADGLLPKISDSQAGFGGQTKPVFHKKASADSAFLFASLGSIPVLPQMSFIAATSSRNCYY